MGDPSFPIVPEDALREGGWERTEERIETLFELPTIRVRGATLRYDDTRSREAMREATDSVFDHPVRFFAATTLSFDPPPPPGVSPTMALPTMRTQVRKSFADQLRERGLIDIERGDSERMRTANRSRVRLTAYSARDPLSDIETGTLDADSLPLECWVGFWVESGTIRVVTGGYPAVQLTTHFGLESDSDLLDRSQQTARTDFFSLVRGVE